MMMLRCLGHGCNINNNLVMIIISSFTLILLLVGNCLVVVAAGHEKLVVELEMMSKSNSRSSSSSLSEELVVLEMAGGYGDKKLSTVLVTGTLLCHDDPCNLAPHPLHPVPGASVALACTQSTSSSGGKGTRKKSNWVEGMTDEHGDFLIDLPSHLHAVPNLEKTCVVKVVQLPNNSQCHTGFTGKHKGIILSSASNGGIRTYTAQTIHMTPSRKLCTRRKEMVYTYQSTIEQLRRRNIYRLES